MRLTWLGHGSWRLEIENAVILIDPWLTGNPSFPAEKRAEALAGATHILITHGHSDHSSDAVALSKELGIPIVGIYDLMQYWESSQGVATIGFNKGGTIDLGGVKVSMVNAVHSSSFGTPEGPRCGGSECGFMIAAEGHMIYHSGNSDIMADMDWFGQYYKPDIGILSAGGHFTMDMAKAAWAARRYFDFKVVIPGHYRTFPILEQSAAALVDGLPGVRVIEPQVMRAIEI